MPTRVHLEPGAAAADHRFRCELTYSGSAPGVQEIRCVAQTTTSFGNRYPASGFKQVCSATYDPMPAAFTERAEFFFPALSIALSYTGTDMRVELDDAEMTASACEAWSLEFSDLRVYVGGVLKFTLTSDGGLGAGPFTVSGDDYRQADNQTQVATWVDFNPAYTHGYQPCSPSAGTFVVEGTAENVGGWSWYDSGGAAWVAEPITIDALACPATVWPGGCAGACTCSASLPSASETDSYTVTVEAERYYSRTGVYLGPQTCNCQYGGSGTYDHYRNTFEYREKYASVDAIAESDTTLRTSRRLRRAGCTCRYPLLNDDFTVSDTETTDAISYAAQFRSVQRTTCVVDCFTGIVACPQLPEQINQALCLAATPTLCYYDCSVMQAPVESCSCTQADPSIERTDDGLWVAVYTCDSDIYVSSADQSRQPSGSLTFLATNTGLTGNAPDIGLYTYDGRSEWLLVYETGGSVKYAISEDWGASWSVSTTVATGVNPRVHITADNRRFISYLDGTDIKVKLYDGAMTLVDGPDTIQGSVDASSAHDITSYSGGLGEWAMTLVYVSGGSIIAKTSADGKAFS